VPNSPLGQECQISSDDLPLPTQQCKVKPGAQVPNLIVDQ